MNDRNRKKIASAPTRNLNFKRTIRIQNVPPLDATRQFESKDSNSDPSTQDVDQGNEAEDFKAGASTRVVLELKPGDQVGEFVIDDLIASGGEGSVYRGHDLVGHENVAIKILHTLRRSKRFHREMEMVQRLAHPNIVTAIKVGDFNGLPYIAMELLSGPDLNRQVLRDGPLDWRTSSSYIIQIARALGHAHERDLTHHDVKPGNIIKHGEARVKLVDLGLASMGWPGGHRTVEQFEEDELPTLLEDSHGTTDSSTGAFAGTLHYMAPEQVHLRHYAEKKADIYSLGATWFYLLTGRERLRGRTLSELLTNLARRNQFRELPKELLPASMIGIYERMVASDPDERHTNCQELISDLEHALAKEGSSQTEDTVEVLVIEDSRIDMLRTISILRSTNRSLNIHQALTLGEGLKFCSSQKVDLVLLDLNLPDSSGVETVRTFRKFAGDVPLIVLTGETNQETNQGCLTAGCNSFISKDQTARTLERHIFVTLSRAGARN
jgi:serine/threonine protein kinase